MTGKRSELPLLAREPRRFARRYWLPLALLVIAAIADATTTLINARRYGTGIELHPVQRLVFEWFGTTLGVPLAKTLQVGCVILVAAAWRPWCAWILGACALLYACAAVSNHFLML